MSANAASIQPVLDAYGKIGVQLLQNVVPKATGKTAQSIRYEVTPNRLVIYARAFFEILEKGRGPRKSSSKSDFQDSLEDWMKAKGIGSGLPEKKFHQLSRFLTYKINKEGDKTFKSGGRTVYSQVVKQFLDELTKEVIKIKTKEYTDKFVKELKDAVNGTISS